MNMDAASVGNKPFKGDPNFNDMKKILEGLEAVKTAEPKAVLTEDVAVTMSGNTAPEVAELMSLMANAGVKPVGADMPMPAMNPDKFKAAAMDDPKIPGKDDVPGDKDLQAGLIGAALGALGGTAAGAATGATGALGAAGAGLGAKAGSAAAGALGKGMAGKLAGGAIGSKVGSAVGSALPSVAGAAVGDKIGDKMSDDYDNSPDEKYAPYSDMTNPPTNDLNKSKKSYPATAGGDNPMALKARIKEQLEEFYKNYK